MSKIIVSGEDFPIQPQDINESKHFFGAFDHTETEVSAGWICRFLQNRRQSWKPFDYDEINAFYTRSFTHRFSFNRLVEAEMVPPSLARAFAGYHDAPIPAGGGWLLLDDTTGLYYVTEEFITRCHKSSPAIKEVAVS